MRFGFPSLKYVRLSNDCTQVVRPAAHQRLPLGGLCPRGAELADHVRDLCGAWLITDSARPRYLVRGPLLKGPSSALATEKLVV
jgi:hypothetical protein